MNTRHVGVVVFCVASLLAPSNAVAQPQQRCAQPVAIFESVTNTVVLLQASTRAPQPAVRRLAVCPGETIQVGSNSRAVILILASNTPIALDQNSEFVITQAPSGPGSLVNLLRGALLFMSRVRQSIQITTPFVNAAIEGTEFVIRVQADRTVITVFEGAVRATNPLGTVVAAAGQQAVAVQGQAPVIEIPIRPRDAVQWALHYEPLLPSSSLATLQDVPEPARGPIFYLQRAAVQLAAGQLDSAMADIQQVQDLDPNNADANALGAIIAVATNDTDAAVNLARTSLKLNRSSRGLIALSYALQSRLDLNGALDAAREAVEMPPENAFSLTRLAELQLAVGDVADAVGASRRAVNLAPELARPLTVFGFASLAKLDLAAAEAAFGQAIALEPDRPLPRLGLGLVQIRRGNLEQGRRDLEIAAVMSPESALIRSYLGKAYFDERRESLAGEALVRAKDLDPRDPTAWFYDAIRKQTTNRPVEALQDLEKAVALNADRAVYRSRLLLDEDLAARTASLGRVYRDLGFEQLALVEGWKSVDADPSDHSGHRFLADMYSTLPRHEVARVSELLQAQLLQPINLTPVSPRLAETDLFMLEGAGPDALAFNEFNPMFNRNRIAAQVSGVLGAESVLGDEVTVSGVWNWLSFSAGQFHYSTDGMRENNSQNRDIYNAFVQATLSRETSVQAEIRKEDHRFGDLFINFDPTDFAAEQANRVKGDTVRFGLKHTFSSRSALIGSLYWREQDVDFAESVEGFGVTAKVRNSRRTEGYTAELRHFLRFDRFRLTSGVGRFGSSRHETGIEEAQLPFPPFIFATTVELSDKPEQTNAYSYSLIDVDESLTVTAGVSADFFRRQLFTRNQFNPKFGVAWRVTLSTTVRAAAFRTLHRAVVSSQTIEPTEVAGFSQLFADSEGTEARRYGVAIDQKFGARLFAGVEYAARNLRVPVESIDLEDVIIVSRLDRTERFARAYLHWTPLPSMSTSAGYTFERFAGDPDASVFEQVATVRTHRFPLAIRYFTSLGITASATAEYLDQRGIFRGGPGEDRFWVLNTGVSYRFPRRYGRVAFEVSNLLNNDFNYQDTDPGSPVVRSGRLALLRFIVGI